MSKFDWQTLTDEQIAVIKVLTLQSLLTFTRFWFKVLRDNRFIVNWHHKDICYSLEEASQYKYEFLNINIPPRHSKTELVGINWPAWSLAKNAKANFLYITASDELRSETSIRIRDIIQHPLYFRLYGVKIRRDQSGKNLWKTNEGGGLKTATIFGQITGFGAGRLVDKDLVDYIELFEGAIILDDINKIEDVKDDLKKNKKTLSTIFTTILSRKNNEETPIVNIQQRAGHNDATKVLLQHYADQPDKVKNIVMPVLKNGKPLWPKKLSLEKINQLKTSPFTKMIFYSQYMQDPKQEEGGKFRREYFKKATKADLPKNLEWKIYVDGAYTEKTENDPTGIMIAAKYKENIYIKFAISKWLELPELIKYFDALFNSQSLPKNCRIFIEPKASGKSLKQHLKKKEYVAIEISSDWANESKMTRANAVLPYCEAGFVYLVDGYWTEHFIDQLVLFPNDEHDEYVDLISYFLIDHYLIQKGSDRPRVENLSDIGL